MKTIRIMALGGAAFLAFGSIASAATSTAQERAETRQLTLEQSQAATPQSIAIDKSTADATPAASPTMPVQTADATAPALAPMALNSMTNPPDKIATARVVDDKGATVGAVQKVDLNGGKPSDVEIALLGSQQIVSLDASKLSYDASNNVVTAALDKSQIVQMPPVPQG